MTTEPIYPALAELIEYADHEDSVVSREVFHGRIELASAERRAQPAPCGKPGHTMATWTLLFYDRPGGPPGNTYTCLLCSHATEIERLRTQVAELESRTVLAVTEGHKKPCYYCGLPCSSLAGNPGRWPIALCHADNPGAVKWHHVGCVSARLALLTKLAGALNAIEDSHKRRPCTHDMVGDEDICDGCAFETEKRLGAALNDGAAALAEAQAQGVVTL